MGRDTNAVAHRMVVTGGKIMRQRNPQVGETKVTKGAANQHRLPQRRAIICRPSRDAGHFLATHPAL